MPTIRKMKLTNLENKKIDNIFFLIKDEKYRSLKFSTNNRQINQPIKWYRIGKSISQSIGMELASQSAN
jgi:hypothetical protein